MTTARPLSTLLRFHRSSGLRVGLRANAIVLGLVAFGFGSSPAPQPLASVQRFVRGTTTSAPELDGRLLLAAIAGALAGIAAPRVTLGAAAWMRSLPAGGRTVRLAAAAVLVGSQGVVLVYLPVAAALAVAWYHFPISITRIVAMLVLVAAVAVASVPARWAARALALGAVASSIASTTTSIALAVVLIGAALSLPGGIVASTRHRSLDWQLLRLGRGARLLGLAMWRRILWRGVGVRRVIACALLPVVICAYEYFITTNNPQLTRTEAAAVIRWSAGIAIALMAAALANVVLISRQPWPWSRSLPWSAGDRVLADARLIGTAIIVFPLLSLPLDVAAALETAAVVPVAALLGASAVRAGRSRQWGAAGETLLFAGIVIVLVAIWPIFALVALALTLPTYRWAVRRERNLRVSEWLELHHEAESDPLWGTTG